MKATLITGASGGIGEAFARRLAQEKHNLVLVARSENKLRDLCDELMLKYQITAHYVALDLTAPNADARLYAETERGGFEIEWLINNAGFGSMGDFSEGKIENEIGMINLNINALVALTHRYLEKMRARKSGVIINVASTASFQPVPFMATYAATKAFVRSFSEAIAEENRPHNIRVMALCPGPTETNFFDASNIGGEAKDAFAKKGMQTSEAVVEAALSALGRGKSTAISGASNWLLARLGNFVPNTLITRIVGGMLRPKFEKEKLTDKSKENLQG